MTSTFLMSVLLGMPLSFLHHGNKPVKEICAVLGAGGAFRMVLNAEHTVFFTLHTLYRAVQQVQVGYGQLCAAEAIGVHGIGVVLGCDFDFSGFQIADRVISTTMSELQLVGLGAIGKRNDLVPQADSEHGVLPTETFHGLDHLRNICGITGAIGKENAIRTQPLDLHGGSIPWNDGHLTASGIQRTHDILLHTAVNGDAVLFVSKTTNKKPWRID